MEEKSFSQTPVEKPKKDWVKTIALFLVSIFLLSGTFCAGYWLGKSEKLKTQSEKPQLTTQNLTPTQTLISSPTPDPTTNWKVYKAEECSYKISWPDGWTEIEHSSNFPCIAESKAPDGSSIRIMVEDNKHKNLDQYLEELDKNSSTGWEGRPSVKVVDSKDATLGVYKAKERKEEWLAAGFTTFITYVNINSKVFSFTILPYESEDFTETEAAKKYSQILFTFKFLD